MRQFSFKKKIINSETDKMNKEINISIDCGTIS